MHTTQPISRVVDLLDPERNTIFNMSINDAREAVAEGQTQQVAAIDGQFALVGQRGKTVRMARSLDRPMRYFIAKRQEGPALVIADRIDTIRTWLETEGLADQFRPSYTRMVPAHHIVEIRLLGCPDPNPVYNRFFNPPRGTMLPDVNVIGQRYGQATYEAIRKWLRIVPAGEPIGVCFSGGIDSGSIFLLAHHALLELGMSPSRLKALTLSVDGGGQDLKQAREFMSALGMDVFLETIEVSRDDIDPHDAIRTLEDYKPLDIEAGAMAMALCRGIRARYADWKYLLDGDGGDENLKDYPIEENPELTIRSVLNNSMLYQEGWGVDSIKHSLTYSGGQSRGCVRTYAPASLNGFRSFSPYTCPEVIAVAEDIPFITLTDWDHNRLYALKGEIVATAVKSITDRDMPIFEKRRFQHGALSADGFSQAFAQSANEYRKAFLALYE